MNITNEELCQQCGTPASPGAKYCESCGALLPGAEPQPPLNMQSEGEQGSRPDLCVQCGTPASPGAKFCERCGTPLPGSTPAAPYGTPPPSYAPPYAPYHAPAAMPYEGVAIRFVAVLIDSVILSIIGSIFSRGSSAGGLAALIIGFLYFTLLEGYYGQTVGKMAVKIKVVREADGGPIDFSQAAVRTVLRVIDLIPYFIPYLLGAILIWSDDHRRQRLGDRIAHTVVIRKP